MIKTALIGLIKIYTLLISPIMGPCCRFHPTCSHYARKAIERHGVAKGLFLGLSRLLKCHPWARVKNLCDPVPETFDWKSALGYKQPHSQNQAKQR